MIIKIMHNLDFLHFFLKFNNLSHYKISLKNIIFSVLYFLIILANNTFTFYNFGNIKEEK
jgi:hypothetical protein